MKTILYMAISANGMIAKTNDDTSWISVAEWDCYSQTVRRAGYLIVGHRTYDILTKQPEFSEFNEVTLIVIATRPVTLVSNDHRVVATPEEALKLCQDAPEVVVAGGGILNASFLEKDLIDEIYLDIEPILHGNGIPLVHGADFTHQLKRLDTKQISENELQLHYQVVKDTD